MHPRQFYEWSRRHPVVLDGGIVATLALFSAPTVSSGEILEIALTVPMVAAVFWRRRRPIAAFTVVSLLCAVEVVVLDRLLAANAGFLIVLYALSAYTGRLGIRVAGLGVGLLGGVLATVRWWSVPTSSTLTSLLASWLLVAAVWMLGDLMRTRRAYVSELEERARHLELERDQQARIARSAERARIAREMHDVVAHSLSIVVAQADGGRYAAETDPEAAKQALETIGRTGRQASGEMRRLLGVLKTETSSETTPTGTSPVDAAAGAGAAAGSTNDPNGEITRPLGASPTTSSTPAESAVTTPPTTATTAAAADPAYSPQPGVARLPQLVEELRIGGLPCELTMDGADDELPEGLSLAVYRVVQEALTNVLKHGGSQARATVDVRQQGGRLLIEVLDDGRGAAADSDGAGHGLSGMAERVELFGGELTTGPRVGGGFRVHASIPIRHLAPTPRP